MCFAARSTVCRRAAEVQAIRPGRRWRLGKPHLAIWPGRPRQIGLPANRPAVGPWKARGRSQRCAFFRGGCSSSLGGSADAGFCRAPLPRSDSAADFVFELLLGGCLPLSFPFAALPTSEMLRASRVAVARNAFACSRSCSSCCASWTAWSEHRTVRSSIPASCSFCRSTICASTAGWLK